MSRIVYLSLAVFGSIFLVSCGGASIDPDASPVAASNCETGYNTDMERQLQSSVYSLNTDLSGVDEKTRKENKMQYDEAVNMLKIADSSIANCRYDEASSAIDEARMYYNSLVGGAVMAEIQGLGAMTNYKVMRGDTLWGISDKQLNDPFLWPLIYWSNSRSINDPDLIYPNQMLKIWADYEANHKAKARKMASSRGAWSLYDNK